MEIGQNGPIGRTVINLAVEGFKPEIEPATTHHLLTVDNFAWIILMMSKTATLFLVQTSLLVYLLFDSRAFYFQSD
jgi:hypothetical protein